MRLEIGSGWHLLRVKVGDEYEWIVCDPDGDRLGKTQKHKAEFDAAMVKAVHEQTTVKGDT